MILMTVSGRTRCHPASVRMWTPQSVTDGRVVPWNGMTTDTAPTRWLYARSSSVSEWSTQSLPWECTCATLVILLVRRWRPAALTAAAGTT